MSKYLNTGAYGRIVMITYLSLALKVGNSAH